MSQFTKTYKDTLRALKKAQEAIPVEYSYKHEGSFTSYLFDLSNDMDPYKSDVFYKKSSKMHNYNIGMPNDAIYIPRQKDLFADTLFLETQLTTDDSEKPIISDDFQTGFYFSKIGIIPAAKIYTSFHCGLSSDGMLRGFYSSLPKKTKWDFYGADKHVIPIYSKKYVNGVKKPCDLFDKNTLRSINVQLSEKIKPGDITIFISDVKPSHTVDVLKQLLLAIEWMNRSAVIILRLPLNWNKFFTSIVSVLLLLISRFTTVKIFKTPWGIVPRLYLILKDPKALFSITELNSIQAYIDNCGKSDVAFLNKSIFDVDADDDASPKDADNKLDASPSNLDDASPKDAASPSKPDHIIRTICLAYVKCMSYEEPMTSESILKAWQSIIE